MNLYAKALAYLQNNKIHGHLNLISRHKLLRVGLSLVPCSYVPFIHDSRHTTVFSLKTRNEQPTR